MSCFPDVPAPTALSYVTACLSLLLSLITIFGNTLIVASVIKDPFQRFRTPFIYFLVNLALSDLIYGLLPMIISVVAHINEAFGKLSNLQAKILHMSYFICVTASVTSIGFLLLDRYLAITQPIKYREKLSLTRCCLISGMIWLFSITISFLYLELGYITYLMLFVHSSVFSTIAIALFCNFRVYKLVSNVKGYGHNVNRRLLREKITTRAFLWIVIVYISLYTPAIVMIYVLHFCTDCSCAIRHVLRDVQFLVISSNAAINPFICAIQLKSFRDVIFELLRRAMFMKSKENEDNATVRKDCRRSQSSPPSLTERLPTEMTEVFGGCKGN